jgi:hypothetical protein
MPAVAAALASGSVTAGHVAHLARATAASPALATELATGQGQAKVITLAARLDGAAFGKELRTLAASLDPASVQREHDEQRQRRFLNIVCTPSGTLIKGQVDNIAGHRLVKAIEALNPRPTTDDLRTAEQRRADALMAAVDCVLTDERTTPGSVSPVQALVVFHEDTFTALRTAAPDTAAASGSTTVLLAALEGAAPVLDETGQAWPASEIGRALCECELTRVVINAKSVPLDLGRGKRLFGQNQWKAWYAAGQRTCSVPGCDMPLRWCELHHINWWKRDKGRTDLVNCAPMCGFHHHDTHRLNLRVTRLPDGSYEYRRPDARLYSGTLRADSFAGPPA